MEKKDFKKGQKAILLSLKNVDFRKTMDIDAATEECTVVKVGRKYITVEDSHGWEIRFDMENNFDGTFYAIKIRAGEFIAVHEKLYCMLTESSNIILLQAKSPIAAYELAVGESMIIDNRKLAAASSSLICERKFLQTLYQMLGIRKRYEEKIIGPGRLWLTDTPIKEEES